MAICQPAPPFKAGEYLSLGDAVRDATNRLDAMVFGDTAKIVARNSIIELIGLQGGTITCHQVAVIASAIGNALLENTYGEKL